MLRLKKSGQSSIEYTVLIIIVIGALLAMQNYFKRGLQGRWKSSVDSLGDQYDPRVTDSNIIERVDSKTFTQVISTNAIGGFQTTRTDLTNSIQTKEGYMRVYGY